MVCAFRSLLISMVLLGAAAAAPVAKGHPPAPHPAFKPPHLPKLPPPPRLPVPHPPHVMPRYPIPPRVNHHPRPMVYRGTVPHVRHAATRIVRQPVRHAAIRTVHRYPVHRRPFRFVRRPHFYGVYGHPYSYYPRRNGWRPNYNRGYGALQRRGPRVIGGIVESVQGIPGNGLLLVKVFRPRSSRFR